MILGSIIDKISDHVIAGISDKEIQKRLFLKECRYNLSLISILDWRDKGAELGKYVIPKLETQYSTLMLSYLDADTFSIVKNNITSFLKLDEGEKDIPHPKDVVTRIVNKIEVLKVIVSLPDYLNSSRIEIRMKNLREELLTIIQHLDK